jgi:hypothetical protein
MRGYRVVALPTWDGPLCTNEFDEQREINVTSAWKAHILTIRQPSPPSRKHGLLKRHVRHHAAHLAFDSIVLVLR